MINTRILFILLLGIPCIVGAQVQFSESTFLSLINQAKTQDKDVMVNVYTDGCSYCHKMDSALFADTLFGDFINHKFLSLSINGEEGFGVDFSMKYRINRFPQILFFDSDGHLKYRWEGDIDTPNLRGFINISDSIGDFLAPLPYPLDFVLDYPNFYRNTFKKRGERSFPTDEQVNGFMASRDSIIDEVTWGVLTKLVPNSSFADSVYKYQEILSSRYGKLEVRDNLEKSIFDRVKGAIKDNSESELYAALRKADIYLGDTAPKYKIRYQLYFYQMQQQWLTYAEMGSEIARDTSLYNNEWLTQIAQTIHRNSSNPQAMTSALNWMKTVVQSDSTYNTLTTEAWLYYKTDKIPSAEKAANAALEISSENEDIDTSEVDALLKNINLSR